MSLLGPSLFYQQTLNVPLNPKLMPSYFSSKGTR